MPASRNDPERHVSPVNTMTIEGLLSVLAGPAVANAAVTRTVAAFDRRQEFERHHPLASVAMYALAIALGRAESDASAGSQVATIAEYARRALLAEGWDPVREMAKLYPGPIDPREQLRQEHYLARGLP